MAVRGINKVILVGRLGKDPEVRYIPNGGAVANLQVATSETWRDKQTGEMREQTEWHRVVLFGKLRGINKVILVGRLGNDPEVRYIPNGGAVANLQVATSESWRDKQTGEMREQTEWHRVVLFGKLAEVAGEYLRKGAQVYIEGQLRTRSWEDNGITRYVTEILVKTTGTVQMLGRAPQQNAQAQPKPQQNGQPQSADATKKGGAKTKGRGRKAAQPEPQPQPPEGEDYGFSDDIPF